MRTNNPQNSLSALKSRISKDCVVEMLIPYIALAGTMMYIDKYHRETSAVRGVMLLTL